MSKFYDEMATVALDSIREFGQALTITRYSVEHYDAAEGRTVREVEATGELTALVLVGRDTQTGGYDSQFSRETLVDGNSRVVTAAAKGAPFVPKPGDEIEIDGEQWDVTGCSVVAPGGKHLLYKMGVRRK